MCLSLLSCFPLKWLKGLNVPVLAFFAFLLYCLSLLSCFPELLEHLRRYGCGLVREGRRHSWYGNSTNGRRSAVPRHTEIPDPLCRKICRDLGIGPRKTMIPILLSRNNCKDWTDWQLLARKRKRGRMGATLNDFEAPASLRPSTTSLNLEGAITRELPTRIMSRWGGIARPAEGQWQGSRSGTANNVMGDYQKMELGFGP
jgi:mRNA interferase HicA